MIKQGLVWSDNEKTATHIHVKVKRVQKSRGVIQAHTRFVRDLKSCMQCRFRYRRENCDSEMLRKDAHAEAVVNVANATLRRCRMCQRHILSNGSMKQCVAEKKQDKMCYGCPYQQKEGDCFPCMKKCLKKRRGNIVQNLTERNSKMDKHICRHGCERGSILFT